MCNAAQLNLYTKERQSQGYGYKVKEWQKNHQPPVLTQLREQRKRHNWVKSESNAVPDNEDSSAFELLSCFVLFFLFFFSSPKAWTSELGILSQ